MFLDLGVPDLMRRAHLMRAIHQSGYPSGANVALFAAMAIEAYPSDLILFLHHFLSPDEPAQLHAAKDLLPDLDKDRIQIKPKYGLLYYILSHSPIPKGALDYQDFSLLIDIRNQIAHFKASSTAQPSDISDRPEKLVKLLTRISNRKIVDRDIVAMPGALPSTWTMLLDESEQFADWCLATARNTILMIHNVIPDCRTKRDVLSKTVDETSTLFNGT